MPPFLFAWKTNVSLKYSDINVTTVPPKFINITNSVFLKDSQASDEINVLLMVDFKLILYHFPEKLANR